MISNQNEAWRVNDLAENANLTGKAFPANDSNGDKLNTQVGTICMFYLLSSIIFISWLLFDIWIGQHTLARWGGYELEPLNTPVFRLVFFTVLGGALGGVVNGIRSILDHYVDFDRRHAWKYIMAPWLGAALALVAYTLLNSGLSIFGADNVAGGSAVQILAMFSTGFLAGYGARDVFVWLDSQVARLFESDGTSSDGAAVTPQESTRDVGTASPETNGPANYKNGRIPALIANDQVAITMAANNALHSDESAIVAEV
jgi:hypothetical protein